MKVIPILSSIREQGMKYKLRNRY